MSVASLETTLDLWASSLREVKERMRPVFTQERVAVSANAFLDGLLGPERRKTGWMRAEAAGDKGPWRQQAILGRARWEADVLRDIVRDYALETLADPEAVLVFDETGFLKQGKASCGVARQYTGSVGKVTNCQIGVFAAYASRHGHAFIDRALYLPKPWASDPARRSATAVPEAVGFATKPQLASRMIRRAIEADVPFAWVAADSVYGVGALEMDLRKAGKGYVLGVASNQQFNSWLGKPQVSGTAEEIMQGLDASAWQRLSAGEGTKGPRLYDWAYWELADLDAGEYDPGKKGEIWTRGLLIRRNLTNGECAYFTTWCPAGTGIEIGLDHNETRSWHGWHRHVSLVMLAFAMLATIRHHANHQPPQKPPPSMIRKHNQPSSAGRRRKSAASPHGLRSGASRLPMSSPGRSGGGPIRPPQSALT
jgi:SRSO17 transposase